MRIVMDSNDNRFEITKNIKANYNSFFAMMKILKEKQDKILLRYKKKLIERRKELENRKP